MAQWGWTGERHGLLPKFNFLGKQTEVMFSATKCTKLYNTCINSLTLGQQTPEKDKENNQVLMFWHISNVFKVSILKCNEKSLLAIIQICW